MGKILQSNGDEYPMCNSTEMKTPEVLPEETFQDQIKGYH